MGQTHYDNWTVILYVLMGIIGYSLIKKMMRINVPVSNIRINNRDESRNLYLWLFVLFYAFFAAMRHVSYNIGGYDAPNYIDIYQNCLSYDMSERRGSTTIEPGFMAVTKAIRFITDSWRVYFFILYGFIAFSYVYFIRKMCPKSMVFIPMVLLAFLYVKGFNTLRSHVAISVFLIGLSFIKDKKWLSFLIIASSVLFHRMSIIFVPIWFFYFLLKEYMAEMSKKWFFIIGVIGMACSLVAARYLQNYIYVLGLLESTTDMSYISRSMGKSIWVSYPMYFAHLALFAALYLSYDKLNDCKDGKLMRVIFIYDLWIVPAALILGMWRFVNYLYVLRLCLWSIILYYVCRGRYAPLYRGFAWIIFVSWFVFRFSREWDDTGISPYIFDFFYL